MKLVVGYVAVRIALALMLGAAHLPLSSDAMAQEMGDEINLNGLWQFEEDAVVKVTHGGTAVRAEFIDGAACFNGEVRPYFLQGELSGTTLTGRMMVCSKSPRLVQECPLPSSMYETTFEATIEADRIAGTRVAQGIAAEERDGRYTSCRPDTRYDDTRPFEGTRWCPDPAEIERMQQEIQETAWRLDDLFELADQLNSTPGVGNWTQEGYTGPAADLAEQHRALEQQIHEELREHRAAWERLRECVAAAVERERVVVAVFANRALKVSLTEQLSLALALRRGVCLRRRS